MGINIYQEVLRAGIKHGHHESDLYIPVNEQTCALVEKYEHKCNVTRFISNTDGAMWYDIPFAYQPYWDARLR